MTLTKEAVASMIDDQLYALNESRGLFKPDPNAGYILVDPVTIVALDYWWEEYKKLAP